MNTRSITHQCAVLTSTLLTTVLVASPLLAEAGPIVVREHLNQTYGPELLCYDVTYADKQCVADGVSVSGAGGPIPAQLTDIEFHPGGKHVKTAKLWVIIDGLAPLSATTLEVVATTKKAPTVTSDLTVVSKQDQVEITTSHVGARFALGSGEGDAPGPLAAMRLGNGAWSGAASVAGGEKITSWSGQLIERGAALARVKTTYTFVGGNTATFLATVAAGDSAVRFEMHVAKDQPDTIVTFVLPRVPGVEEAVRPQVYGQWATRERKTKLTDPSKPFSALIPNSSLPNAFADKMSKVVLQGSDATMRIESRDPGAWVDPGPLYTFRGEKQWNLRMIDRMWAGWRDQKHMPITYAADGTVTLEGAFYKGARKWLVASGDVKLGDWLNKVKDMVLEWPSKKDRRMLFVDKAELRAKWLARGETDEERAKACGSRHPGHIMTATFLEPGPLKDKYAKIAIDRAREQLGRLAWYDVMRGGILAMATYDGIVDSGVLSEKDRKLFRAQAAYLAYILADPMCWSAERGYVSGNPNMSCSYILTLGVAACALPNHPMSKPWSDYATGWLNRWLDEEVGAAGEWVPEGGHYSVVSVEPQISYAIAAKRAGYHDFTDDPRLKSEMAFFAKMYTPRDPQRKNIRVTGVWGRGVLNDPVAVAGLAAKMTAKSDPEYSKAMQWMSAETDYSSHVGDSRMGGYCGYYLDESLPQAKPDWGSHLFPELGVLMRHGFGTPNESYINVLAGVDSLRNLDVWVAGVGDIAQWYAKGKPISKAFSTAHGYNDRHELISSGVRLARNYKPGDTVPPFGHYSTTHLGSVALLPQCDYVSTRIVNTDPDMRGWTPKGMSEFPEVTPAKTNTLELNRQVMQLKSRDEDGRAYLIVRDTTTGGEPTAWQFWTLSEKMGAAGQVKDVDAFLKDAPGAKIIGASKLSQSDRYTALGTYGVDLEYYVASPSQTPRHTMRYGGDAHRGFPEWQDVLMLHQPGDGSYFVAMYPRLRTEAAPTFATLAGGTVIKTAGAFGSDYVFLSAISTTAGAGDVSFEGTAGAVQQDESGVTTLSLGAAGKVQSGAYGVAAPFAVSVTVKGKVVTIELPKESPGGELTLIAPSGLKGGGAKSVKDGYVITAAKGASTIVLR